MLEILISLFGSLDVWFRSNAKVQLQIVALRHQLAVSHRHIQDQSYRRRIVFSGSGSPASGRIGAQPC